METARQGKNQGNAMLQRNIQADTMLTCRAIEAVPTGFEDQTRRKAGSRRTDCPLYPAFQRLFETRVR